MKLGKDRLIFTFLIFIVGVVNVNAISTFSWQTEEDMQPYLSFTIDGYNNNLIHPYGASKPDDEELNFINGDPIHISWLKIERDTVGPLVCERVQMDFVANVKCTGISTQITSYSDITEPVGLPGTYYFTTVKTDYHSDTDKNNRFWVDRTNYHEGDSNKRIFLGPNHVYKVVVLYTASSVDYIRVFWLVEKTDSSLSQRWDIWYNSSDTFHTTFADKGFGVVDKPPINYSIPPTAEEINALDPIAQHNLSLDSIFGVIFMIYIGSFLIQIGFALYIKFQAVGSEVGAIIIILVGMVFIGTAIMMAVGVVSGIVDALKFITKPLGTIVDGTNWIWDSTIGQIPGVPSLPG